MVIKEKNTSKRNLIIVIALVVLVIVAAVQAVQLFSLKSKLGVGQVNLRTGSATTHVNAETGISAPAATSGELPQMVGGC